MELFKRTTQIDFMARRRFALPLSALLLGVAIVGLALRGLSFGIDFTGGVLVEVRYPQQAVLTDVRRQLADAGFEGAVVQYFGTPTDVLIRLAPGDEGAPVQSEQLSERVLQALRQDAAAQITVERVEYVGPQVGQELANQGGLALLVALFGILVYVSVRFEWRLALGAVGALVHDVLVVLGLFAWAQVSFDLSVLAAVLAVIGYSLNDTIVVFDRIRDGFLEMRRATPPEVVNVSINQTLSRTLMTSGTTLLVLIALALFGGTVIQPFAIALIAGIVIGTYSSIYVASVLALGLGVSRVNLLKPQRQDKPDAQL
ncbi:MAG TPA: protein translocase subunit SecF [Gammaproteobacteria bacterium]|nr:protein translocase subunit SecF [Gammaproteobacteria bacterium]